MKCELLKFIWTDVSEMLTNVFTNRCRGLKHSRIATRWQEEMAQDFSCFIDALCGYDEIKERVNVTKMSKITIKVSFSSTG
jgi:hypothetical protein